MLISAPLTSNSDLKQRGFSLIEVLIALVLVGLMLLAYPGGGDSQQRHRDLQSAVSDIDRSVRFASNESVLRNTVVRLSINMDKDPVEYTVEYGPAGNLPLPDMESKSSLSMAEEKSEKEKMTKLDQQFNKVEEFQEIQHEISRDVSIVGVGTTSRKRLVTGGLAHIYFYPTGEKDGAMVFFATEDEIATLEVEPFLSETHSTFEAVDVAKGEEIIQTRVNEVYKQWIGN